MSRLFKVFWPCDIFQTLNLLATNINFTDLKEIRSNVSFSSEATGRLYRDRERRIGTFWFAIISEGNLTLNHHCIDRHD